jgi:TolB-like protein
MALPAGIDYDENMKHRSICLLLIVLLLSGCATSLPIDKAVVEVAWECAELVREDAGKTLAVYYFTGEGEESPLSNFLIDSLTTELANAISYEEIQVSIVSRQVLDRIMAELAFQHTDLADRDTQISIGRQLGAELILTGTITPVGEEYKINAQVLEVETGVVRGGMMLDVWLEPGFGVP